MTSNKKTIAKATLLILFFAGIGKVLGFVREMVVAAMFGTSAGTDAYFIGVAGPDFIREIVSGGVLTAVFIPMYAQALIKNDREISQKLSNSTLTLLLSALLLAVVLGIPLAPYLVRLIAPELAPVPFHLAVQVTRIIFPAIVFMGIASFFSAVLNTHREFTLASLTQPAMNAGVILGALTLGSFWGVKGLAAGFLLGSLFQVLILLPSLRALALEWKPEFGISPEMKRMLILWLPMFFCSLAITLNDMVSRTISAGLSSGNIAGLTFANRIRETVWLICGVPLATAIFPFMSTHAAADEKEELKGLIDFSIRLVAFIALPLCLLLLLYAHPVVQILFERGAFTAGSTDITSDALVYYSIGAFFYALNYVILRVYYSLHEMIFPLKAAGFALVVNIAMALALRSTMGVGGIALARSISDIGMSLFLLYGISSRFKLLDLAPVTRKTGLILMMSIVSVAISFSVYSSMASMAVTFSGQAIRLALAWGLSGVLFIASGYVLRLRELETVLSIVKRKIAR